MLVILSHFKIAKKKIFIEKIVTENRDFLMKTDVNMDAYSGVVFLDSIVTSNCFQAVFDGT